MTNNLEYKSIEVALKSFDEIKGIFKGYASSFGKLDAVNDTITPGAYDKDLDLFSKNEKKIPINFDHFPEIELSNNLISMSKDDYGLLVEFKVSDEAKEIYSELYGDLVVACRNNKLFMSVGFYIKSSKLGADRWIKKMVANANDEIYEAELDHIAVTKNPVDSNAKMLEVKSRVASIRGKSDESTNLNKLIQEVDGEVSATKLLVTYKSQMSNTNVKNLILHLKSLWTKNNETSVGSLGKHASEVGSEEGMSCDDFFAKINENLK